MKIEISFWEIEERIKFKRSFRKLIVDVIREENKKLGDIHFIYTGNNNILRINREFLNHSYYTDVITFDDSQRDLLSGEIYISVDQVLINARKFKVSFLSELIRVSVHGVLHLAGYGDQSDFEKKTMRIKEDTYLCRFKPEELVEESEI